MLKNPPANALDTRLRSLNQKEPLEESLQPIPVFLPGESHGQKAVHRIAKSHPRVILIMYACNIKYTELLVKKPPKTRLDFQSYH